MPMSTKSSPWSQSMKIVLKGKKQFMVEMICESCGLEAQSE